MINRTTMTNRKPFSTAWNSSTRPGKQRKYSYTAPLHRRQALMHAHLARELRTKYGYRHLQVRTGDTVKVMRGQFAKKEGKVERVQLRYGKVYVAGIELIKKDGTKRPYPLHPSNLLITALELGDRYRKEKLESKIRIKERSESKLKST